LAVCALETASTDKPFNGASRWVKSGGMVYHRASGHPTEFLSRKRP